MKTYIVKDLMVPISEYATVPEDATLFEAVLSLEKAQELFDDSHIRYRHRAILVLDKKGHVVGKVSQLDVLKALEPKYQDIIRGEGIHRFGFTKQFLKSMLKDYLLFAQPLQDICRKAGEQIVKNIMQKPTEGEYISENASLDEAIHLLVMANSQSLLVTRKKEIVGILRQTDVFASVFHTMKQCFQ